MITGSLIAIVPRCARTQAATSRFRNRDGFEYTGTVIAQRLRKKYPDMELAVLEGLAWMRIEVRENIEKYGLKKRAAVRLPLLEGWFEGLRKVCWPWLHQER